MAKLYHVRGPKGPQRAFLALPTYDGKLHGPCLYSLLQSLPLLEKANIGYDVFVLGGNCHVDDARNGCVREFLLTDCTDLVFIDADVGWRPEDLVKLLGYDRDIVAGVYPKKTDSEDFPVHFPGDTEIWSDADGLIEVHGAPTGFMRIRRNVLEAMCEKYRDKQYHGQSDDDPNKGTPYTILFERTFDQGYRLSGDYAFCFKWRFLGGKVFVDPEMVFVHEGLKEWGGSLGDFLKRKHGVYAAEREQRTDEAVRRLRAGETSDELFSWLVEGWANPWSVTPEFLATVYRLALQAKGPILECGSGITTLVLAIASEVTGNNLISLEHERGWLIDINRLLDRYALNNYQIELTYSPLITDARGTWYLPPEVGDDLALVICDGPQRKHGRGGLYRIMGSLMRNATVIADDCDDEEEVKHIAEWSQANDRRFEIMGEQRPFGISMKEAA